MNIFQIRLRLMRLNKLDPCRCQRFCTKSTPNKKYSDTILLPRTKFPTKVTPNKRKEHEANVAANSQFDHLYGLQRLWRKGHEEFILHDGPPYANGDVHIGHAVNKILKDITNRYKLLRGYQVNYIPGWDCHGLPIELKALKDNIALKNFTNDPVHIRGKAREVAQISIEKHIESFRRWGVMADWNSAYKTFDINYIKNQLHFFYQLYEKDLVYRDMKPVYWSPSSKTALAEAELEYNPNHESTSVYLAVPIVCSSFKEFASSIGQEIPKEYSKYVEAPVNVVFWTTTPWSLPSNAAIAYNESQEYSVVFTSDLAEVEPRFYVVATECIPTFLATQKYKFSSVIRFNGSKLAQFQYRHPWFEDSVCPFLPANHVTMEKGTGLVHTAPAHGPDDYILGLQNKLSLDCFVNEEGKFDNRIPELTGMPALTLATTKIVNILEKKILSKQKYVHSYPYDWRTKKPVIVKTSMQWFIDTDQIKSKAVTQLENVAIHPPNTQHGMLSQLAQRQYWCISRQRVWGVPIPVLFHKETGKPLVHKGVIDRLCDIVEQTGNIDAWWEIPVGTLLQNDDLASQYEKGRDIFDIWFDSGTSWHILGEKQADVYLEGLDQFTGWFQASLLTSVALRGFSPYKNIYVHGFVVDDSGKKMSKSLGNVVDPAHVVDGKKGVCEPFGADVLRWWCATQGSSDASKIAISSGLLQLSDDSVQKLRNTFRFLVSFCTAASIEELKIDDVSYDELMYVDQYMLSLLRKFQMQVTSDYEKYNYHRIMNRALHFVSNEVSSQYLTWIKDRLYCDFKESQSRKSCIYVLNEILLTMSKILAPVLPFLCEEVYAHYNNGYEDSVFKSTWFDTEDIWENKSVESMIELALDVRTTVNQMVGEHNSKTLWAQILCNEKTFQTLQILHPTNCPSEIDKCFSELCDILQLSGIDLKQSEDKQFTIDSFGTGHSLSGYSAAVGKSEMFQCHRCRRHCCTEGNSLCTRCQSVLNRLEQQHHSSESGPPPPASEIPVPDPVKEEILIRS